MSTMGMQVELSMTAKGVQATLKDAQGAIVQTASIIKSQLPAAADTAGQGIEKLKTGLGRARETAMFFTQSLQGFGPAGQTAQMALSGIGSMMLGGGVLGLGLAAAQVGVKLLTSHWDEQAKAAEEAAKAAAAAAKKVGDALAEAQAKLDAMRGKALVAGSTTESGALANEEALAIAAQQAKIEAARAATEDPNLGPAARIDAQAALTAELQILQEIRNSFLKKQQDLQVAATKTTYQAIDKVIEKSAADREQAEREQAALGKASHDASWKLQEEEAKRLVEAERQANEDSAKDMAVRLRLQYEQALKSEELAKKVAAGWAAAGQSMGAAMGTAFGAMLTGAQSVSQGLKAILKAALTAVVDAALKQIDIAAVVAGAEAFKSQAGIPGVGPFLGAAAAAAVMASVHGMIGMISASGGADIGNYAPMAQLHPREMVLPAHIADPLRESLAGGGMGGGTVNLTVNAMDGKSVRRVLLENGPALAEAIGRATRDGRRFG